MMSAKGGRWLDGESGGSLGLRLVREGFGMARTSRHLDAGVATINPSAPCSTSSGSNPSLLTVQRGRSNDHPAEKSLDDHELAAAIRAELAPEGVLETLLVDRVILASWFLQTANRAEAAAIAKTARRRGTSSPRPARGQALLELRRESLDAQHALERAIELLQTLRDRRRARWGRPLPIPPASPVAGADGPSNRPDVELDLDLDLSNEWPVVPGSTFQEDASLTGDTSSPDVDGPENWQGRLIFDFNVSETSPVVKGTWVTVGHVVSLIVDGWTWGDILRTHPELSEEDIRVCLAYTIAQDNGQA